MNNKLFIFLGMLYLLILLILRFRAELINYDFRKGKNIIYWNKKNNNLLRDNREPNKWEIDIRFSFWFSIILTSSFFVSISTVLLWTGTKFDSIMLLILGVFVSVIALINLIKQIRTRIRYRKGIFKLGGFGVWTSGLGFTPWYNIKEISIFYKEGFSRGIDESFLEIVNFDNGSDRIKLYRIGFNKNKIRNLILKYAPRSPYYVDESAKFNNSTTFKSLSGEL